jgi:hypothetical protein
MNTIRLLLSVSLLLCAPAIAELKLPSKVYDVKEMEAAQAEAKAKGKPIAILYTDKASTCPLCNAAALTMVKELGNKTVMVYTSTTADIPQSTRASFSKGQYIPKVAVFDSTLERALGMVTYEAVSEDERDAFREIERSIRAYTAGAKKK